MSKKIFGLDDSLFEFKKLNADKSSIDAEIISADYSEIEKMNAELREKCKEHTKAESNSN